MPSRSVSACRSVLGAKQTRRHRRNGGRRRETGGAQAIRDAAIRRASTESTLRSAAAPPPSPLPPLLPPPSSPLPRPLFLSPALSQPSPLPPSSPLCPPSPYGRASRVARAAVAVVRVNPHDLARTLALSSAANRRGLAPARGEGGGEPVPTLRRWSRADICCTSCSPASERETTTTAHGAGPGRSSAPRSRHAAPLRTCCLTSTPPTDRRPADELDCVSNSPCGPRSRCIPPSLDSGDSRAAGPLRGGRALLTAWKQGRRLRRGCAPSRGEPSAPHLTPLTIGGRASRPRLHSRARSSHPMLRRISLLPPEPETQRRLPQTTTPSPLANSREHPGGGSGLRHRNLGKGRCPYRRTPTTMLGGPATREDVMSEENKDIVRDYYARVIDGHSTPSASSRGRAHGGRREGGLLRYSRHPDMHVALDDLIAEGDPLPPST